MSYSSFQIATNVGALKAYNALASLNKQTQTAQLRIATQKRINSVADDTSGYNTGKALEAKVALMKSAQQNVGSAQDMLSTAESQLSSIRDSITDIKAKIADSGNSAADLDSLAADVQAIADEIDSAISSTKFNDTELLTSTSAAAGSGLSFQTGVETSDELDLVFSAGVAANFATVDSAVTTLSSTSTRTNFENLESSLDTFETTVSSSLGKIGNYMQRLDSKSEFLTAAITNSESSVSRLFDADLAEEQLNATSSSVGASAATAMLSQLNTSPANVLSLFR
jgi:flagellin-like hook-associated protein FlgL